MINTGIFPHAQLYREHYLRVRLFADEGELRVKCGPISNWFKSVGAGPVFECALIESQPLIEWMSQINGELLANRCVILHNWYLLDTKYGGQLVLDFRKPG